MRIMRVELFLFTSRSKTNKLIVNLQATISKQSLNNLQAGLNASRFEFTFIVIYLVIKLT